MSRKVKQIDGLVIDEISLVGKGANQHAQVTIAKSADGDEKETQMEIFDDQGNPVDVESLSDGDVVYDAEGNALRFELDPEDTAEALEQEELEPVGKSAETNPFRKSSQKVSKKAESDFAASLREELSKAMTDQDRDEVVSKALDQVELLAKAANEATEIAKAERDARLTKEYTEIAKSYTLPINDDALGATLLHCAQLLSEADCEVIAKCLEAASANVLAEQGANGGGGQSDVLMEAQAAISKSNGGAEGYISFFEENPDAYDEYLAGN